MRFGRRAQPELRQTRLTMLSVVLVLVGGAITLRLVQLQVIQHGWYAALASEKHETSSNVSAQRGSIFVRDGDELYPIVTNRDYFLVFAEPKNIKNPVQTTRALSEILELTGPEEAILQTKLSKTDDPYEPIKRKVPKDKADQISALDIFGVGLTAEHYRYYPDPSFGGHVVGFTSVDGQTQKGQYGLEGYFNEELSGTSGVFRAVRDAVGGMIGFGGEETQAATNGVDLVLTMDRHVQSTTCSKLKQFFDRYSAERASAVIMDPQTGAVIAMCNVPDFNPNEYQNVEDIQVFNNAATFYAYEPGSVFKPLTMAAAIDQGKVSPETKYTDTGEQKIAGFTIRNFDKKARGVQTMTQVLENSLNTGAMFAAEQVGKGTFLEYVEKFGFGKRTGITLASESAGDISALRKPGEIYYLTSSFGQGITVTPIQLAAAFGAIANGGKLYKPYLVSEIRNPDGTIVETKPEVVRQVISQRAATMLTGMMVSVVEKGYDDKAQVPGYYLAGKTGTAQLAGGGGAYGTDTIHSFVGFGPARDPKFVIVLRLDRPKGIAFAADSLSPLFQQLSEFMITYYQLPPEYAVQPK
jgi:stage V sporulation protein D (sporulation-specific penicillin-binding protein)